MLKQFLAALAFVVAAVFGAHTPPSPAHTAQLPRHPSSALPAQQPSTALSFATSFHPNFTPVAPQHPSPPVESAQSVVLGASGTGAVARTATPVSTNSGLVLGAQVSPTDTVTHDELTTALDQLANSLRSQFFAITASGPSFSGPAASTPATFQAVATSQRIDQLSETKLSNVTVSGVAGLTASDIPTDIVAANYLPLGGGTVAGNLSVSGNFTVAGAQTLSGAITIPYLTATSTTASSFLSASSSLLSVFTAAYFGGTATSTFDARGFLTLPSGFLSQASSTIGSGTQAGGLTISGGATTTGDAYFTGKLVDNQGTSHFLFNSWAPRLWEITDGTSLNPITAAGPTFKISKTEAVASTTCNSNNVDNECNAALVVESNGTASAASSSQQTAAISANAKGQPIGTDVVGLLSTGDVIGSGKGTGTGAYLEGRRDTSTGNALGAEIRVSNITSVDGVYNPNGFNNTAGLWITTNSPAGAKSSAGISFGGINGSKFLTGIGFTSQSSVASTSIRDDSSADTSIQINGTHNYAFITGSTAGNVGLGTLFPTVPLEVVSSNSTQGRFAGTGSSRGAIRIDNAGGQQSIFEFLDGGTLKFQFGKQNDNSFFGYDAANSRDFLRETTGGNVILQPIGGNVGIGTTTPGWLFSVQGVANWTTSTSTYYSTGGINLAAGCFAIAGSCLTLSNFSGILSVAAGGTGASTFGQGWLYSAGGTGALAASTSPSINYITATSTIATSTFSTGGLTVGTSQFVIQQNSGNVGIGTTTPLARLSIDTSNLLPGVPSFVIGSSTRTNFF